MTYSHCCIDNLLQESRSGNRDTSGAASAVAKSKILLDWRRVVDAKLEVVGCGDKDDWTWFQAWHRGKDKEGRGHNVRLLVWVIGWILRFYPEEMKTKQGQVKESSVMLWHLILKYPLNIHMEMSSRQLDTKKLQKEHILNGQTCSPK